MKITIELDEDEVAKFAQLPSNVENIFWRLDDQGAQLRDIQEQVRKMPSVVERIIHNRIGG